MQSRHTCHIQNAVCKYMYTYMCIYICICKDTPIQTMKAHISTQANDRQMHMSISPLYLCLSPSVYLSIHPFIYLSIFLSFYLSIYLSTCFYLQLRLVVYPELETKPEYIYIYGHVCTPTTKKSSICNLAPLPMRDTSRVRDSDMSRHICWTSTRCSTRHDLGSEQKVSSMYLILYSYVSYCEYV